ncbi:MAG: AAA family ATPase [Bryobacteraceae bacterium]|nr:AAA family ATPase [Bryobacteraceae bacterium]
MKYLAITHKSAGWLLEKAGIRELLLSLMKKPRWPDLLTSGIVAEGPLRIAAPPEGNIMAAWNVDYLGTSGLESWGFVRLSGQFGLLESDTISTEVLERSLYVVNQRLQALLIDSAYMHRSRANGVHSCLSGRGDEARQLSIAYFEAEPYAIEGVRALLSAGPARAMEPLVVFVTNEGRAIPEMVRICNGLLETTRRRPTVEDVLLKPLSQQLAPSWTAQERFDFSQVEADGPPISEPDLYTTLNWSYDEWIQPASKLTVSQRKILETDPLKKHPVRLTGPAGSGKTLLLQLMAMRLLRSGEVDKKPTKILYLSHNSQMAEKTRQRFLVLGAGPYINSDSAYCLDVTTLSEFAFSYLNLETNLIIDKDAEQTKEFQMETLREVLKSFKKESLRADVSSQLLRSAFSDEAIADLLCRLVSWEISISIKGRGLESEKRKYIESEQAFSRFHAMLEPREREFVFDLFDRYHTELRSTYGVMDSDDVAISMLGSLRTPLSQIKRKSLGYDFVLVDEVQLFNENERRVFPLLSRGILDHVPIALALDEAQDPHGQVSAGLGLLGIHEVESELLSTTHRSTGDIVKLAFFVLQRTTDLFSSEFPDYTEITKSMVDSSHRLARKPIIVQTSDASKNLGKSVVRRIREMRKTGLRQIAVVCHADAFWRDLSSQLTATDLQHIELLRRGADLPAQGPFVVLSKPDYVGGQEFDGVIAVGLEEGVTPPRIVGNDALAIALEQQALREIYLSVSRARFQVAFPISAGSSACSLLKSALTAGLVELVQVGAA